jgi:hypothetical protein
MIGDDTGIASGSTNQADPNLVDNSDSATTQAVYRKTYLPMIRK